VSKDLIKQPHDPFWDSPPTRRELQAAINKLAANDSELAAMADTASILINYICEIKLNITSREEVDVYVEAKRLQMEESREKLRAEEAEAIAAAAKPVVEA
jgi:hypothetical protein